MPVAAHAYAPFDTGAGANSMEATWRRFMAYMMSRSTPGSGVIRGVANANEVYADNSGMLVKVKPGEVWLRGHWGELTAEITLPIAAAHATLARKDRVIVRCDFGADRIEYDVLPGTPSGSPVAQSPTQSSLVWEVSLAVVDVPALDTAIGASQVSDARRYIDDSELISFSVGDTTVNNTAVFADVTSLRLPVSGSGFYTIDGFLEYSSATGADIAIALNVPTGTVGRLHGGSLDSAATGIVGSYNIGTGPLTGVSGNGAGTGTRLVSRLGGWLRLPDSAAGGALLTVTPQVAQLVATASDTVLYADSWFKLTRYRAS